MCRILGYKTKDPERSTKLLIKTLTDFRLLAKNGCVPCGQKPGHMDGWGIVAYKEGAIAFYYRFSHSILSDKKFENILMTVKSIKPDMVIAHLRKASVGENIIPNIQPFVFDNISLCHNGTIKFPEQMYKNKGTDSWLFFRMLDTVNPLRSFKTIHKKISASYEYTAMNMLVSDGKSILAACNWNEEYPRAEEMDFKKYYTLHVFKDKTTTFICSEAVTSIQKLKTHSLKNKEIYEIQ